MNEVKARLLVVDGELSAHKEEAEHLKKDLAAVKLGIKKLRHEPQSEHFISLVELRDSLENLLTSCRGDIERLKSIKTELVAMSREAGIKSFFLKTAEGLNLISPSVPGSSIGLSPKHRKEAKAGINSKKYNGFEE